MSIITNRRVLHSKIDQNIWNKEERTRSIFDSAVPITRNCVKMYVEKLTNYRNLESDIQKGWNMQKVKTIPVMVGALGIVYEVLQTI